MNEWYRDISKNVRAAKRAKAKSKASIRVDVRYRFVGDDRFANGIAERRICRGRLAQASPCHTVSANDTFRNTLFEAAG